MAYQAAFVHNSGPHALFRPASHHLSTSGKRLATPAVNSSAPKGRVPPTQKPAPPTSGGKPAGQPNSGSLPSENASGLHLRNVPTKKIAGEPWRRPPQGNAPGTPIAPAASHKGPGPQFPRSPRFPSPSPQALARYSNSTTQEPPPRAMTVPIKSQRQQLRMFH